QRQVVGKLYAVVGLGSRQEVNRAEVTVGCLNQRRDLICETWPVFFRILGAEFVNGGGVNERGQLSDKGIGAVAFGSIVGKRTVRGRRQRRTGRDRVEGGVHAVIIPD